MQPGKVNTAACVRRGRVPVTPSKLVSAGLAGSRTKCLHECLVQHAGVQGGRTGVATHYKRKKSTV